MTKQSPVNDRRDLWKNGSCIIVAANKRHTRRNVEANGAWALTWASKDDMFNH